MVAWLASGARSEAWPWVWLAVAVAFALVELTVLGGSFVLLPFAVTAFAASLLAFAGASVAVQWAVFVVGGAAAFAAFYRWSFRFVRDHALPPGVGADRLVGAVGVVTAAVDPDDAARRGRVSVDGETWGALSVDGEAIAVGARVRVHSVQGTRLLVAPDRGPTPAPPAADGPEPRPPNQGAPS